MGSDVLSHVSVVGGKHRLKYNGIDTIDTELLDGVNGKLDDEMKKLNAGFVFAYVPGDHFTIHTKEYWNNGMQFLALRYEEWLKTR